MTKHTTIVFKRDGKSIHTVRTTVRGRWLANCENKAMRIAEQLHTEWFMDCYSVHFAFEDADSGKLTHMVWLLGHDHSTHINSKWDKSPVLIP